MPHARMFMDGISRAIDELGKVCVMQLGGDGQLEKMARQLFEKNIASWQRVDDPRGAALFDVFVCTDCGNDDQVGEMVGKVRGTRYVLLEKAGGEWIKDLLPEYETVEEWPVWFWAARLKG